MSGMPPIVALVLHFRNATLTRRCLDSLLADGVRHAVLVDNSQDGGASLSLLAPWFSSWSDAGFEILVEQPGRNLGFSAGVNRGLAAIHQRHGAVFALLLNSDAAVRPGASEALRAALRSVGKPSVAAACMVAQDGRNTPCAYYQQLAGLITLEPLPGSHRYLSACCLMLSPDLAFPGLFDEDFFFYGEDIELGWRLRRRCVDQLAVAAALVDHEGSGSSRNGSLFYEYHMATAHIRLPRKLTGSTVVRVAMLLLRAFSLPARATVRSLRFRSAVPWRALVLATADAVAGRNRDLTPPAAEQGVKE